MKPKLLLTLALVLGGGLFGKLPAEANIVVPVVAAPKMRECQEAKVNDLGFWDDAFRFEDSDFVLLRKQDALFTYSPATDDLRKIRTLPSLVDSRLVDGMTWGKHQWLFCQSQTIMPFALDLSNWETVTFEIPGMAMPGKSGPAIHAVINAGFGPGTIIAITGDDAAGWPRDGNRPLYYWMDLDSGKVTKLPTGWDLSYFSADQKRAVFENISTNAMMYRPWVTVDMATGEAAGELPDQTKDLWSEPISGYWHVSTERWGQSDKYRHVWELRSPRTPAKLLHPQPGRGIIDDKFVGLAVNGVVFPLAVLGIGRGRCSDANVDGALAIFTIEHEGGGGNSLWATRLNRHEPPWLLATNCSFQMLGSQHCVLRDRNQSSLAFLPEALDFNVESNTAWNILGGVLLQSEIAACVGATNRLGTARGMVASGAGPMVAFRMIPGFGSARYPTKVLCLCSTHNIVPDYMIPPPVQRMAILLTTQGRRYQVTLPSVLKDTSLNDSWLHNSGKLIVCQYENTSGNRRQMHLYMADLRADQK